MKNVQIDEWVWGRERILWGYEADHKYTFKLLEPKRGRDGCLSLQYHHDKSESWLVLRGVAWALVSVGDQVCTRLMWQNDLQNLPTGTIHRLMGVTDDVQVLEPSTPDAHAADKSLPKDVVRLHCVQGRECAAPRDEAEAKLVAISVRLTEEAVAAIDRGEEPPEHNRDLLDSFGAYRIE